MEGEENFFHYHLEVPCNFFQSSEVNLEYFNAQDIAFLTPLTAKRKLFENEGIQIQDFEAEDAWQTCQNQPEQGAMQAIHHGGFEAEDAWQTCQNQPEQAAMQAIHHGVRPARKLNSETRCLNEQNMNMPNGTESSEVCILKSTATSGSMTPMTPIERKRLNDKNYRKRKREENKNLLEENKNLHENVRRLSHEKAQLKFKIEQLACQIDQPKSSRVKRKAKFQLDFHDDESKKAAMNLVLDLPGMDTIHLKGKKRILKLEGSFDAVAVLDMLNKVCVAHLLSKMNIPSWPRPSTVSNVGVPPVKLR